MNKRSVRGFTLIELMVVVAVIGILAAIAFPKFANMVAKAKEGRTLSHLGVIRSALSVYYADNEVHPGDLTVGLSNGRKYLAEIPSIDLPGVREHANPGHAYSPTVVQAAAPTVEPDADVHWFYANSG